MKFFLLQKSEEIELIHGMKHLFVEDLTFLIWNALVLGRYDEKKISVKYMDDFYDGFRIDTAEPNRRLVTFQRYLEKIDGILHKNSDLCKRFSIMPFSSSLPAIKSCYLSLLNEIEKVSFICAHPDVEEVFFFEYQDPFSLLSALFSIPEFRERFPKIKRISSNHCLEFSSTIKGTSWGSQNLVDRKNIVKNLKTMSRITKKGAKAKSILQSLTRSSYSNSRKALIFNSNQFTYDFEVDLRVKQDIETFYFEDLETSRNYKDQIEEVQGWEAIADEAKLVELLVKGIPVQDIFFPVAKSIVFNSFPGILDRFFQFIDLDKKFRFDLVVGGYEVALILLIESYLRSTDRKMVIHLHGGTIGVIEGMAACPVCFQKKGGGFSFTVYSKWIKQSIEAMVPDLPNFNAHLSIYPTRYFEIVAKKNKQQRSGTGKIKICIVSGGIGRTSQEFKLGLYSEVTCYRIRQKIVDYFNGHSEFELIFKYGYHELESNMVLDQLLKSNSYPNIRVIGSEQKLSDIISEFDYFYCERPSTASIEIISCSKNVGLCYDERFLRLNPEFVEKLPKNVWFYSSIEQILGNFRDILERKWDSEPLSKSLEPDSIAIDFLSGRSDTESREFGLLEALST